MLNSTRTMSEHLKTKFLRLCIRSSRTRHELFVQSANCNLSRIEHVTVRELFETNRWWISTIMVEFRQ